MNTIKADFLQVYNRAFNAIRNRSVITQADLGKNIKVRVIGRGTPIQRKGTDGNPTGLVVMLFNTNVMDGALLAPTVAMLQPDAFNAAAESEDKAVEYLRAAQNMGSIPFTVPVTNQQIQQVGQGATIDATVVAVKLNNGPNAGQTVLGLNFNRVIAAETVGTAASAFDALLAGVDGVTVAGAEQADPFSNVIAPPAPAGRNKAAATA